MLTLLISIACSAFVSAITMRFVTSESWIVSIVAVVIFVVLYILLSRSIFKKISVVMNMAQKDVMANRAEKAISDLKAAYKYGAWQFYVKDQINSQIGTILYIKRDFNEALPYLEKGIARNWVGMSMLGVSYMKKNKPEKMISTFDKCLSANKKEVMPYALYAFCLDRIGNRERAIDILKMGLRKAGDDERLSDNVALLETGKKMRMQSFGDMWYQFHLEKQGRIIKQQTKAMTGRRKQVVK